MTVSYVGIPMVIGFGIGIVLADVGGLSDVSGFSIGLIFAVLGVAVWGYSPLPDSNGGMAASRFNGEYWGWSPPRHMTTEEFVCRDCGHGPMLFDTRAADLHHRFEENRKHRLGGRSIMYVGRCENCNKKIGWRDKAKNPAPDPPEGYSEPAEVQ